MPLAAQITKRRLTFEPLENRALLSAVSIDPASTLERDSGQHPLAFTVSLDHATTHDVSVNYHTQGIAAQSGSDYSGVTGVLTIPPGQAQGTISVQIRGDTTVEPDETFALKLSSPSAGDTIATSQAIGTILNDDGVTPTALNVLDFGAKGDGTTNNDSAFAAALSAAQAQGKALFVPAGIYAHANLIRDTGVELYGEGNASVLLATNPLQSSVYLFGTGVKLHDLQVTVNLNGITRQTTPQTTGVSLRPGASNFVVQNVAIDKAGSAGLFNEGGHDGLIDHVTVTNTLADAIHNTFGAFNVTIQNCYVRNSGDDCIAVVSYQNHGAVQPISHDFIIQNNDVGYNPWGRGIAVAGGNNVQILNNTVAYTSATGIYIVCESSWQTYGIDNVLVRGNHVTNAPKIPNPNGQPGIEVGNQRSSDGLFVTHVTIDQNIVDQSGTGYTGIRIGPDASWIAVTNNTITTTGKRVQILARVANLTITNASVVGQTLFYKGSTAWNVANGATFSDDNAIAPDKTAYLPDSGTSAFSAVSSYDKGINGVMVDILGTHGTITANDFIFKVGNNNSPSTWTTAPSPTMVTTRVAAGSGGSDRVELLWADNAIQKTWLQVIVKGDDARGGSDTNTGLSSSYVFYFGSEVGDAGVGNSGAFQVNGADEINARNNPKTFTATRSDVNDLNRDGSVNSSDQINARNNPTNLGNELKFLVVGAGGPFAPESSSVSDATPLATSTGVAAATSGSGDGGIASALATNTTVGSGLPVNGPPPWPLPDMQGIARRDQVFRQLATASSVLDPQGHAKADDNADELAIDDELLDSLLVAFGT